MRERVETVELYVDGNRIAAMCTLCRGRLSREVPPPPANGDAVGTGWNLYDLLDAMSDHYAANHATAWP